MPMKLEQPLHELFLHKHLNCLLILRFFQQNRLLMVFNFRRYLFEGFFETIWYVVGCDADQVAFDMIRTTTTHLDPHLLLDLLYLPKVIVTLPRQQVVFH